MSTINDVVCIKRFEKRLKESKNGEHEKIVLYKGKLSVNEFMDIEDIKFVDKGFARELGRTLARYPTRFGFIEKNDKRRNQRVKFWYLKK